MKRLLLLFAAAALLLPACQKNSSLFTDAGDVGSVSFPGTHTYDARTDTYTLTGSGANLWDRKDACYLVWKKVSGDFDISAEVAFIGEGTDPHRKIGFMVRESLDEDARYADIAIHGDGLTSLQYRAETGGITDEAKSPKTSKGSIPIAFRREGDRFSIRTGNAGDDDAWVYLALPEECYLGLFICSHNDTVTETATFRGVSLVQPAGPSPKISIFTDHIATAARQEGLSFAEAAARFKGAGYTGADIRVLQRPEEIRVLDSLGFAHACAIADIPYAQGDQTEMEDLSLAFMKKHAFRQLLLVPGLVDDKAGRAERDAIRQRIAAFTRRAAAEGFTVMVEDYDNARSLCYNAERLDSLFSVSAELGFVFDSGNFLFAGEDALENLTRFQSRVGHIHLKDRAAKDDMRCVPAGTGCIPMEAIIRQMEAAGYKGWYTVEQYGSASMLPDCLTAYQNVRDLLTAAK